MLTTFDPPLARALLTPSAIGRVSRSFVQLSLQSWRCHRARGNLMRTDGSSPSNVSLAARSETPNPACTLVAVARSTSACDIELGSSALLFLDDGFEGLAATKNIPPLRITSTSVLREVHIANQSWIPAASLVVSCPTHDRLL